MIKVLKEANRLPGYSVIAGDLIMAGNVVQISAATSQMECGIWDGAAIAPMPLGFVLDNPLRSTLTNATVGQQSVTEYNRGGLVGIGVGPGAVYQVSSDASVDVSPATGLRISPIDQASTAAYAVNGILYATDAGASITGVNQLTGDADATNAAVGRILSVTGTGMDTVIIFVSLL